MYSRLVSTVAASAATALEPGRASDSSHDEETQRTETSTTIEDLAPSTSHVYVSPRDVYSIPKAQPRKSKGSSRKGKTQILTATPVREKFALLQKQREAKKLPKTKKVKKNLFRKKSVSSSESSDEDEAGQIEYDDDSDCSLDDNIIEGDFVVVNVTGRGRLVRYIARVDSVDADEYEGVFLQKVPGCLKDSKDITFVINEDDEATFLHNDIVFKLPPPVSLGSTARRANQVRFNCELEKWNLA